MLIQIQRLRYKVYCEEMGYLPPSNSEIPQEQDEYDDRSTSFYARAYDDSLIGTGRFINPVSGPMHALQYCKVARDIKLPPWHQMGEVSRLILPVDIRCGKRRNDFIVSCAAPGKSTACATFAAPQDDLLGPEHGASSFVLLGLFRAMYQHSKRTQVGYWTAAMSPLLNRLIRRLGFHFDQIGPINVDEGIALYMAAIARMEQHLEHSKPRLLHWLSAPPGD